MTFVLCRFCFDAGHPAKSSSDYRTQTSQLCQSLFRGRVSTSTTSVEQHISARAASSTDATGSRLGHTKVCAPNVAALRQCAVSQSADLPASPRPVDCVAPEITVTT